MPNKLINEKSPYLLQHAQNPVDWYPWGEEALALAKAQNKPIFLSIGYSTCHWCHIMEHESFENPKIASIMNRLFINIKVDREERPDLDAIYMSAVQALSGTGGWPMSVWLTPDLKPFYGGTYFPPEERYGRPGFGLVLTQLGEAWEQQREKIVEASQQISTALELTLAAASSPAAEAGLPDAGEVLRNTFQSLRASFDPEEGGFGPAPKFPMPVYLDFLLRYYARTKEPEALRMAEFTMRKIAGGGITDQLGGGFARYSTDPRWVVPHFEKMLYDNAQLIAVTVGLYQASPDAFFLNLARRAIGYVLRDMQHPEGGFYSAEDADSEGKEGAFYLWTVHQVKNALDPASAEILIERYGLTEHGNFMDPHTREAGQNVLVQAREVKEVAQKFGKSAEEIETVLAAAEKKLFELREKRPRPHRDDKILTEWNGLMISALAKTGAVLKEPAYLEAARRAAFFIETRLFDSTAGQLYRRWRDGERKIEAQQSDYAFLVEGLLDLYEAAGDKHWLEFAAALEKIQDRLFFDAAAGGYYMNVARSDLLFRMKDDGDNVIPSGNSVAALNGLRLSRLTGEEEFGRRARQTLAAFGGRLRERPVSLAKMTAALDFSCQKPATDAKEVAD